jgi:hypothetical protein
VPLLDRVKGWFRGTEGFAKAVTEADVEAAFGRAVSSAAITPGSRWTEAKFRFVGPEKGCVKVVIARPVLTDDWVDDPEWFPRRRVLHELSGVGDAAFVTKTGGVVTRLGVRWIVRVEACGPRARWKPPPEQSVDLLSVVLARLATIDEPWAFVPRFDRSKSMERWRERYRVARRKDVLAGLPIDEIDAREDARFAADRLRISLLAGIALSIGLLGARLGSASSWASWLLAVTLLSIPFVGVIWLTMGFQAPSRERRRLREDRRRRQRERRRRKQQLAEAAATTADAGTNQSEQPTLRERLAWAAALLLAFALSGGISWGLFQESAGTAIVGEIGRATVGTDCSGSRTRRCEVSLRDSRGVPVPGQAMASHLRPSAPGGRDGEGPVPGGRRDPRQLALTGRFGRFLRLLLPACGLDPLGHTRPPAPGSEVRSPTSSEWPSPVPRG